MITYGTLFIILYFCAIFDITKLNKSFKNMLFICLVAILVIFVGIRHNVGADFWGYYNYFNRLTISIYKGIEIGFETIIVLSRNIFGSYNSFLFIVSTLTFIFIYKSIKNMSKMYFIPLYVYVIQYLLGGPMGQIRQALAIAILLYSVKYIIDRNVKKFVFLVFMATSIHITSIVFLIAYCVNYIKINKFLFLLTLILALMIGKSSLPRNALLHLSTIFNFDLFNILNLYIESGYGSGYSGPLTAYIERLLIFLLSLLLYKENADKKIKVFIKIYWVSLLIFFIFADIGILAQRVSRIFKIVEIFLYPFVLEKITMDKYLRIILYLFLALLMFKPIYMILSRPHQYIPYTTFFNK